MKHTTSGGNIYQTFDWKHLVFPSVPVYVYEHANWEIHLHNSKPKVSACIISESYLNLTKLTLLPSVPETWFQVLPNCLSAANQVHVFSYHFQMLSCLPAFWRVCTRPTHLVSGCCWAHVTPETAQQSCEARHWNRLTSGEGCLSYRIKKKPNSQTKASLPSLKPWVNQR